MTRYFCSDPSHLRDDKVDPVDVTAQVRLERSFLPRSSAYLAFTQDVIADTLDIGNTEQARALRISRVLSGMDQPENLPVVLVSRDSVSRPPGRYELDELRAAEPVIERLATYPGALRVSAPSGEVLVIDESESSGSIPEETGTTRTAVLPRVGQTISVPQGVFLLDDLTAHLATADVREDAIVDAIRSTPVHDPGTLVSSPWRVVIECPRIDQATSRAHLVVFTGTGDGETPVVWGTKADGWDAAIEASGLAELEPAAEVGGLEHRVWLLLAIESAVALCLIVASWAAGTLRSAAAHTPWWLALSFVLAVAGIAFGAIPLFRVHEPGMNVNDTFELAGHYDSRASMLRLAAAVSAALFGLGLMAGVIPPLSGGELHTPAAFVTFDTAQRPVTATMRLTATDVAPDKAIQITIREYAPGDPVGVLLASVTRYGDPSGVARAVEMFAVDPSARYLSVSVNPTGAGTYSECTPIARAAPGCTVVSVPTSAPPSPSPIPITNIVAPTFTSAVTSPSPGSSP